MVKRRPSEKSRNLREEAERRLQFTSVPLDRMSEADVAALVHELRVHEVELEMQNEQSRQTQVELEQSRSKYADLFDFAPIGYFVLDEQGCIAEVNLTGASMLKRDRRDLIGKPFSLFVDSRSRDRFHEHRQAVFKGGQTRECEIRLLRPDEAEMVVRLRSQPRTDPGDETNVVACRTAMTDVTALTRAQARLRASEHQFRTLAENSPDVIARMNRDGHVVHVNARIEQLTGLPVDEIVGRTPDELDMPVKVRSAWSRAIGRVFDTGCPQSAEFEYALDGVTHYFSASLVPERTEDGTVETVLSVIRDVTTQRRIEQDLRRREEQLRLAVEGGDLGTWDRDLRADEIVWSQRLYELLGRDPDDPPVTGETFFEYIHPDDLPRVREHLAQTMESGEEFVDEFRIVREDGRERWLASSGRLYRDERGRAVRMAGVNYDITDRMQAAQALRESEATYRSLFESIDEGFCTIEVLFDEADRPVDYRFLEVNPSFERHTGIKNAPGRRMREIAANHEEHWFEIYGRVARSGEAVRFEDPAKALGRFYEVYAFRVGAPEQRRVAILFNDITDRKEAEISLREARDRLEERVRERTTELERTADVLREEVFEKIEAQKALEYQNEILQKIIDNIPVMLTFYDAEGNVALVNAETRKVLGYTLEDFQENGVMELCYPDPAYRKKVWEFMMAAEGGWREFLVTKKQGGKVVSNWANVRLSDGSYVGIGIDVRRRKRYENRIRESEERYRTLVELSPDGIGVERKGTIRFVNSTACRLLGAGRSEALTGRPILDFIHPDYRERAARQLAYLERRRKPLKAAEAKVVRLDGTAVDVELSGMPIAFENKPATQIVIRDITQRKEAEARLHENAIQLREQAELLDLAHDTILVHDLEGRITFWNQGAERTYGWSRDEAVGRISHELLRTQFPEKFNVLSARLLEEGRWSGELRHTTRSGQTVTVSSRWALQRDEDGAPVGILEIDRDITDRKQAEHETFEARRFAESVIETIQEALVVLDAELKVLSANRTFYETFEVTPEETQGRAIFEIGNRQWDVPELRRLLEEIIPQNTSFKDFEVEREFERIGRRAMLLNARRIYRENQQTRMILLAIQDVTIRKQQERAILDNQRQLAELTEELLLTEERERRRIATALHDSIGQSLAFSKRELGGMAKEMPERLAEPLARAREQIDQAIRQTRSLTFELSPATLYTFGLEAAVEELAEQFARREGFRCRFQSHGEGPPMSEQTKVLLYRATRELLVNVAKHAAARRVTVRMDHRDASVCIEVEDDGKGFDTKKLSPVQGRRLTFGLFSIRERLAHMNGTFEVRSAPGHGTKVTMQAPLEPDEETD